VVCQFAAEVFSRTLPFQEIASKREKDAENADIPEVFLRLG
jgi:hypothetical protein